MGLRALPDVFERAYLRFRAKIGIPGPNRLYRAARNIVFTAQDPLAALETPPHYKIAVSADPAYRIAVLSAIPEFKKRGRTLFSWSDCRFTSAAEARSLAETYNLAGWIGQGETPAEFDHAIEAGAQLLVGNPNSWGDPGDESRRDLAKRRIAEGTFALICECYRSESGHPWPDEYGTQGVDVASWCIGVYPSRYGYFTVPEYLERTPEAARPHIGMYYAEGARPEDRKALP
jgi:hypothetical protein